MSFWTSKTVKKSRKDHKCDHCYLTIPKGTSYKSDAGTWEGDFFHTKAHPECDKKYREFNHDTECGDPYYPLYEWEGFRDFKKELEKKYPK